MLRVIKLKLDPHADIAALRHAFDEALQAVAATENGDNMQDLAGSSVNVADQDVLGIEVWFSVPCADPNTSWEVACAVREQLIARAARLERETGQTIFASAIAAGPA